MDYAKMSDQDLVKILIREKHNERVTEELFNKFSTLSDLLIHATEEELLEIKGVGINRTKELKAAYELYCRLNQLKTFNHTSVRSPKDVFYLIGPDLKYQQQEQFKVLLLNTKNQVTHIETVTIGTLNASLVHPREVFRIAIRKSANAIIIAHNHPSFDCKPSAEDLNITQRIVEAGNLLGIHCLDHIIVGGNDYVSLKEIGQM